MFKDKFEKLLFRLDDSNKYSFGNVLVIGGSNNMMGASVLVSRAALRTGSGLSCVASRASNVNNISIFNSEIMTLWLHGNRHNIFKQISDHIKTKRIDVVVVGNGWSLDNDNRYVLNKLIRNINLPIIIDGGGLAILGNDITVLDSAMSSNIILTPHLGEFRKLINYDIKNDYEILKQYAVSFSKKYHVSLVIKGHNSFFVNEDFIYKNATGNPGLATAGTGDVLAGVIAGMIGQHIDVNYAVPMALYLHGLAGDIAANNYTQAGMIAGDVVDSIPYAYKKITTEK